MRRSLSVAVLVLLMARVLATPPPCAQWSTPTTCEEDIACAWCVANATCANASASCTTRRDKDCLQRSDDFTSCVGEPLCGWCVGGWTGGATSSSSAAPDASSVGRVIPPQCLQGSAIGPNVTGDKHVSNDTSITVSELCGERWSFVTRPRPDEPVPSRVYTLILGAVFVLVAIAVVSRGEESSMQSRINSLMAFCLIYQVACAIAGGAKHELEGGNGLRCDVDLNGTDLSFLASCDGTADTAGRAVLAFGYSGANVARKCCVANDWATTPLNATALGVWLLPISNSLTNLPTLYDQLFVTAVGTNGTNATIVADRVIEGSPATSRRASS